MSYQSKFFKFMTSDAGRNVTMLTTAAAAVGASALVFIPHAFMSWKYKEVVTNYHQGVPRELTKPVMDRFEVACELLKLPQFESKFTKAFCVTGLETRHIGSLRLRFGANVGIPANYAWTSPDDIDKQNLIIKGNLIDWSSTAGQLLEEALVLKDDEQIFGIAREILYMKENNIILQSLYPAIGIMIYYFMTHNLNTKLQLFSRPLSLRIALYGICGFFAFGIYAFAVDYHQVS
jgi:hypothetical protein